jgi:hypothetical protein
MALSWSSITHSYHATRWHPRCTLGCGRSATIASVVINSLATEAASCNIIRTTLVGRSCKGLKFIKRFPKLCSDLIALTRTANRVYAISLRTWISTLWA